MKKGASWTYDTPSYELLPLQGVRRLQTTISQIVKRL